MQITITQYSMMHLRKMCIYSRVSNQFILETRIKLWLIR